jgi:hypothetical protein
VRGSNLGVEPGFARGSFQAGRGAVRVAGTQEVDSDLRPAIASSGFCCSPSESDSAGASVSKRAMSMAFVGEGAKREADQPRGLKVWGGLMVIFME